MADKKKFAQIRGTLQAIRRTEPARAAVGAILINDHWIRVTLNTLPHIDTLTVSKKTWRKVRRNTLPVTADRVSAVLHACIGKSITVGIRYTDSGECLLLWLVSDSIQLTMQERPELLQGGQKSLVRWAPWFLLSLAMTVLCIDYITSSFAVAILLLLSAAALLTCGIVCYMALVDIYAGHFDPVLKQAWTMLDAHLSGTRLPDQGSTGLPKMLNAMDARNKPSTHVQHDEQATPPLRQVSGPATQIKVDEVSAGVGRLQIDYQCFQFNIGRDAFVLFASKNQGGGDIFLAEADKVTIVIADIAATANGEPQLVWALHNLEDEQKYVCHRIMKSLAWRIRRPFIATYRMTILTPYYYKYICRILLWLLALDFVGSMAIIYIDGGNLLSWDLLFLILITTLPWGLIFAGLSMWVHKWRHGHPTTRQRLTERVYTLLDLPSVFDLPDNVHEV